MDPRGALASMRQHPVKVALWLALMRPTEELFARESFVETTQDGETRSIPAVLAWAETIARKAIRGDMQAAGIIADRIEGKVGTRRDEEDPEDERRRGHAGGDRIRRHCDGECEARECRRLAGGFGLGSHARRDRRRGAAPTRRR